MVQVAQRDTAIKVTDQEIADGVEQQFRNVRQRFTSELDFRSELDGPGFQTPEEFRRWLTDPAQGGAPQPADREAHRTTGSSSRCSRPRRRCGRTSSSTATSCRSGRRRVSFRNIVVAPRPSRGRAGAGAGPGRLDRRGAPRRAPISPLRPSASPRIRPARSRGATWAGSAAARWCRSSKPWPSGSSPEWSPIRSKPRSGSTSSRCSGSSPPRSRRATSCSCRRSRQDEADSARALAAQLAAALRGGAPFDSLARLHHDAGEEREADDVPVTQLPEEYKAGHRRLRTAATVVPVRSRSGRRWGCAASTSCCR